MRAFRLASLAAEAEGEHLKRSVRRAAIRAILGLLAFVLFVMALIFAQFGELLALEQRFTPLTSDMIVVGGDLVIVVLLAVLAIYMVAGRAEKQAAATGQAARATLFAGLADLWLLAPLVRRLGLRRIAALVFGAVAARYLTPSETETKPAPGTAVWPDGPEEDDTPQAGQRDAPGSAGGMAAGTEGQ